jgi:hypothetical protein
MRRQAPLIRGQFAGNRSPWTLAVICLASCTALVIGCQTHDDSLTAPQISANSMLSIVTGMAAQNLDASGHFRLQGPPSGGPAQLSKSQAEALATLWPRQFGTWIVRRLEREHGTELNLQSLTVCGRTFYAESPLEPLDISVAQDPGGAVAQRVYGPWWLVTMCGSGAVPQLSLGVSAYATDLTIENGVIHGPAIGGEWFSPEGIPVSQGEDFLEAPERAAQHVAGTTGRRVSQVPRLIIPVRPDASPNHSFWAVKLDAAAAVRPKKGGPVRDVTELYDYRRPGIASRSLEAAAPTQPNGVTVTYVANLKLGSPPRPDEHAKTLVRRQPGMPMVLEPVTPRGEP